MQNELTGGRKTHASQYNIKMSMMAYFDMNHHTTVFHKRVYYNKSVMISQ
jgi:hypothetical protein